MSWAIREMELDRDAEKIAQIYTWSDEFTWSTADFVANVERWPEEKPMHRVVAVENDEVVGYGRACLISKNPVGSFVADVMVEPRAQGNGIGRALTHEVELFAAANGARAVTGLVRESRSHLFPALKKWGYEVLTLYYECVIDPRTFELCSFSGLLDRVEAKGYEIKALAELPVCEETDRALHKTMLSADHDAPYMEYFGFMDYDDYRRLVMEAQWYDRNGVFVATKDGEIVGLSSINRGSLDFNGQMFIEFTGVVREQRGHGLATAMKARALEFAKNIGGTMVRTENNTENHAMRAVNLKLGFKEKPGQWMVVKQL